jgi:hypothetical protein
MSDTDLLAPARLNWLSINPLNLPQAGEAVERMARDGNRASNVVKHNCHRGSAAICLCSTFPTNRESTAVVDIPQKIRSVPVDCRGSGLLRQGPQCKPIESAKKRRKLTTKCVRKRMNFPTNESTCNVMKLNRIRMSSRAGTNGTPGPNHEQVATVGVPYLAL